MKTIAPGGHAPTDVAADRYSTGSIVSKDGTTIGYRQLGRGPGLIVLHGAMESARSHMQFAEALAPSFTVYLPDRRGRGLSGPYRKAPRPQKFVFPPRMRERTHAYGVPVVGC